ncbi:ArsR/SmtB family transcription factor [Lacrimispora aerotolerans]|jgi:ArsR family transcriptional regulator|uniref:ArsR/SmtB family transcription factor n=1 Tax=Lacrimispora aerotolerans TaxID=36832 RepID=UPI000691DAB6|nr:metalloregulator ArsR/SmtB family transcription factor [Lacrimispora aerotolerans]
MVELFKALSEESRLRILALLMEREMCVCEIEAILNMTQSNASRHLSALKSSGILTSYKKAQWTYYQLSSHFIEKNKELWIYLQINLKEIPSYQEDYRNSLAVKVRNLCSCQSNSH